MRDNSWLVKRWNECALRYATLTGLPPQCVDCHGPLCTGNATRYEVLARFKPPRAAEFWEEAFPGHCRPSEVFYAAVKVVVVEAATSRGLRSLRSWTPVVLVACDRFEHGDTTRSLADLHTLASLVYEESFDENATGGFTGRPLVLDPVAEVLLLAVEPLDKTGFFVYSARRLRAAVRAFRREARRAVEEALRPPRRLLWRSLSGFLRGSMPLAPRGVALPAGEKRGAEERREESAPAPPI